MLAALDPRDWAELQGMCAKELGRPRAANPYSRKSALRRRWAAGHKVFVPREAMKRPGPGRGRSRLGLRREWTPADDATALLWYGGESAAEVGRRIGKTGQAVRNRMHRLRKREDARAQAQG